MAEYVPIPLNAKLHIHRNLVKQPSFVQGNSKVTIQRKHLSGSCKNQFSPWNSAKIIPHSTIVINKLRKQRTLRCYCIGALESAGALMPNWILLVDQGLLMTSMLLTHMAGVIPVERCFSNAQKSSSGDKVIPESSWYSGSAIDDDNISNLQLAWDTVGKKLSDSLTAMKGGVDVGYGVADMEQTIEKRPSSLSALAVGSRLRLLWACFQWLNKEVRNLSKKSDTISEEEMAVVFRGLVQASCRPLCMTWLEEELRLKGSKFDKVLFTAMVDKFNGYDNILQNIKKSSKEDLYVELICLFRSSCIRKNNYYGYSLFSEHLVDILEDLVITLADGIANMYLELISVDSNLSNEVNSLGLSLCTLSTRELQKLRNEVALHQWLHQNMEAIVSMYEDRFELFTLQSLVFNESRKREDKNFSWWKKLSLNRSDTMSSPLSAVVISPVSVTVKRTKELRALTGWRYFFSLLLELSDIAMPLVRTVIAKVSDAISFFLVCLIGRSLGLIYTGIRQSLRWK